MKFKTIDEWRDAASLQFTVYMPFVNWLRIEKNMSNDDIAFCDPNYMVRYEEEYFRYMTSIDWN